MDQIEATQTDDRLPEPGAPKRDWLRLVIAHMKVIALAPCLSATFFVLFGPDRASLLTFRGVLTLLVGIVCTYIAFGVVAAAAVLVVSPALSLAAKIPNAKIAFALCSIGGTLLGWAICMFIQDLPAFQWAAAVTTGIGCALLERAWRRSWSGH